MKTDCEIYHGNCNTGYPNQLAFDDTRDRKEMDAARDAANYWSV
jgi:hypothetical protein